MEYFLEPWAHQKKALDLCRDKPGFAFFIDMGGGKSGITVNALREKYYKHKRVLKTLIVCPAAVVNNWPKEFAKHASPSLQAKVFQLAGTGKERAAMLEEKMYDDCIFVTNFETMSMKAVYPLIQAWGPEALVVDEVHRAKNPRAKRTEALWKLADFASYKYILSGTPILQSSMDIWAQYRILDGGETFGPNFYSFRARFFEDKNAGMPGNKHFPKWEPLPGTADLLHEMIYKKAIRVMKDECLDLPPLIRQVVEAPLSKEQASAYKGMLDDFVTYLADDACTAELAITRSLRLQQIISGHAKLEESGEVHKFPSIPRLNVLAELAEAIPSNSKFVIWACFRENYNEIKEVVENLGITTTQFVGGMTKAARDASLEAFKSNPQVRCMIANPASAGVGVDGMQVANYSIYYSRSYNLEHDLQSNDRTYRGGSEIHDSVTRIDIVSPGTIDEVIRESLANKLSKAEAVLAMRRMF